MDCGVPFCTQGCPLGNPIPDFAHLRLDATAGSDAHRRLAVDERLPGVHRPAVPGAVRGARACSAIDNAPVTIEAHREGDHRARVRRGLGHAAAAARAHRQARRDRRLGPRRPRRRGAAQPRRPHRRSSTRPRATPAVCSATASPTSRWRSTSSIAGSRSSRPRASSSAAACTSASRPGRWTQLRADHDAVVIAIGAQRARELDVPGRELDRRGARDGLPDRAEPGRRRRAPDRATSTSRGKRVIILGGGDTGSDCLGTALSPGRRVRHADRADAGAAGGARGDQPVADVAARVPHVDARRRKAASASSRSARRSLEGDGGKLVALHGVQVELVETASSSTSRAAEMRHPGRHADPRARLHRARRDAARRAARRRARRAQATSWSTRSSRRTCPGVFCRR